MIIIGMVVLATLGIAMYTLTYTANMNQIVAQRAARANYISESGIRIAASEYKAAADTAKNSTLVALHGKTFTLPNNGGSFTLSVYPYWLYVKVAIPIPSNTITLYLPGAMPRVNDTDTAITFPTTGYLKVKDTWPTTNPRPTTWSGVTYVSYSNVSVGTYDANVGTPVEFTLGSAFTDAIVAGDEFYVGYLTTQDASQTGSNLTLYVPDINMANMFPPQQGTIFVVKSNISYYKYDSRTISSTGPTVILTNIQNLDGTSATPNVLIGNAVYVGKSVGFRSTSTYGAQ